MFTPYVKLWSPTSVDSLRWRVALGIWAAPFSTAHACGADSSGDKSFSITRAMYSYGVANLRPPKLDRPYGHSLIGKPIKLRSILSYFSKFAFFIWFLPYSGRILSPIPSVAQTKNIIQFTFQQICFFPPSSSEHYQACSLGK